MIIETKKKNGNFLFKRMDDDSIFVKLAKGGMFPPVSPLPLDVIERAATQISEQASKRINDLIFEQIHCPIPVYYIPKVGERSLLGKLGKEADLGRI